MKHAKKILLLLVLPVFISCQEKFDGKDEQSFKISREKIEQKLDKKEKINLEKAIRVIALESMRLKWEEPEKYNKKSFDTISLEMIDGLSYSSLISLAEDILTKRNKKEIEKLTTEINNLTLKNKESLGIQKRLDLFKIDYITLNNKDWFGEMVPELEIGYKYTGKESLKGPIEISFEVLEKSTKKVISAQAISNGDAEYVLKQGELIENNIILKDAKDNNPQLWNKVKYPVEKANLSDFDLELNVNVLSLFLNGKKVEMPKSSSGNINVEIKQKQKQIENLKAEKTTLDDLI